MKRLTSLFVALACIEVSGCTAAQTQCSHLLRPDSSVSGMDGVWVSVPAQTSSPSKPQTRATLLGLWNKPQHGWSMQP